MPALLTPTVWRALAIVAALAALVGLYAVWTSHQRNIGRAEVRAEWQADKLSIAEQTRILLMANAKKSGELQVQADKRRRNDNAENHALDLRVDELRKRLRDRPERPDPGASGVPALAGDRGAGSGNSGCLGTELYRSDGEFLTGLAARADKLRIALRACRAERQADIDAVNAPNVTK